MSNKKQHNNMPSFVIHSDEEIRGFFGPYRFLSNFFPAHVHFCTQVFPTVEHAFVAAKSYQNFDLHELWEDYCNNKLLGLGPGEVKKLGRLAELPKDWEETKTDLMASLVFDKFYRNKELRTLLVETGDKYLEETNIWHDNYWGKCVCEKCVRFAIIPHNNLGKMLMRVRLFWID